MDKIRVMVVEGNEVDMTVITNALIAADINYLAVPESTMALQAAIRYKPSIVLLDMDIPECDGKEVQRQLRTHPDTANIKIILLSATASKEDIVYGLSLQASAYFKKGVRIGSIIESINAIDGTTKLRATVDEFGAYNKRMVDKYAKICEEGDKPSVEDNT